MQFNVLLLLQKLMRMPALESPRIRDVKPLLRPSAVSPWYTSLGLLARLGFLLGALVATKYGQAGGRGLWQGHNLA